MVISARADAGGDARRTLARRASWPDGWVLAAVLLVAAGLRFATLGAQSYWFDEAQAAHELQLPFGSLITSLTTHETNPPLYFGLGWVWARVFGTGELGLRSLSALAGVAAVAVAYGCGRELVSRRAGLVAATLAAINPFMIWYSQEAREYMLLAALSGASLLWFARARRERTTGTIVGWAIFSWLALLTHFFAAFLVWPEALWLLVVRRGRATALACAALLAAQLALLPFALTHATSSLLGFVKTTPLSIRLEQVPVAFGLGSLYQSQLVTLAWVAAGVLAAVIIVLLVAGAGERELRGAGVAAALAACVVVLPLAAALTGHDFLIARALMPAWIPLAVLLGAACTARHARLAGAALAVALTALFVYGQVRVQSSPQYQRPDWRGVAHALGRAPGRRAIVLYDGGLATDPLAFYLPRVPWTQPALGGAPLSELDVVGSAWQQVARPLPAGSTLLASRVVQGFRVVRVRLRPAAELTTAEAVARAGALLAPAPPAPAVLIQPAP